MADPNLRSLAACLRCRRLKVKCAGPGSIPCQRCKSSGAECQFVQPRAITRAPEGLEAPAAVDHSEHLSRLESQIAQLTGVVEHLRSDFTDFTRPGLTSPAHGNLIQKGIVAHNEFFELHNIYLSHCNDTIAIFDGIPEDLDTVQQEPVLLAAVCAIGARASLNKPKLYQDCLAEATTLISSMALGPLPSLLALRGIMLIAAWHQSHRLWGMVVTLAYEMGLHEDALRLFQHARQMSQQDVERGRTWLSILCFELMAHTHRPYLIQGSEQYMGLARDLISSPHSRPVDQRIMAYLELFKIVVEAKKSCFGELAAPGQEALLSSLNGALDTWFHRVHNAIDPLYQTFSTPQDRNRLVIPYAFVRLYINKLVLDAGLFNDKPQGAPGFAHDAISAAIEAALLLLSTAFDSRALAQSLRYTIDYSSMTLTAALSFLSQVVVTQQDTGIVVHVPTVADLFQRARMAFEAAGARSHSEWVEELMQQP